MIMTSATMFTGLWKSLYSSDSDSAVPSLPDSLTLTLITDSDQGARAPITFKFSDVTNFMSQKELCKGMLARVRAE